MDKPVQLVGIIAIYLVLTACVYVPTPELGLISGHANIPKKEVVYLKNAIGLITLEEVLLKYGEPSKRYNSDEFICYGWKRTQGVALAMTGDFATGVKQHWLCLQFDKHSLLARVEEIAPFLFENADEKRDQILNAWNNSSANKELVDYNSYKIKHDVVQSLAEKGYPEAQWRLYFEFGRKTEDIIWLCRSADNGYAKAQLHVGHLFWDAHKIKNNKSKAYVWYKLSSTGDYLQRQLPDKKTRITAEEYAAYVRNILGADRTAQADILYTKWKPGQCAQELLPVTLDSE